MKKIVLTAIAACATFFASAQINQGAWLVGASSSAGFVSYNEDAGDYSEFDITVKGGYFVIENLVAGLNLGYGKSDDVSVSLFGVFARYYVNGKIFVGAGFDSQTLDTGGSSSIKITVSQIPIEVGYAAFINDVIAVEPALNYTAYGSDGEGASFGLRIGLTVYLGRQ
jgi:hypothetical protein